MKQAINSTNPTYFFNRAKCYKELGDFKKMLQDTTDAIEMDDNYVKAFVANGEALIELGKTSPDLKMIDKGI